MFFRQAILNTTRLSRAVIPRAGTTLSHPKGSIVFHPQRAWYSASSGLSKQDITDRILDTLKDFEKVSKDKITTTASFSKDLGLDSLDAVEVVMAIEEEFGIEIPDVEADAIQTVEQGILLAASKEVRSYLVESQQISTSCRAVVRFMAGALIAQGEYMPNVILICGRDSQSCSLVIPMSRAYNGGVYPQWHDSGNSRPPLSTHLSLMCAPKHAVKLLSKTHCILGEGPLYEPSTATLHFVDIMKNQVLHYNTKTAKLSIDQLDEPIGCLALRRNGKGIAVAAKKGFAILESGPPAFLHYVSQPLPEKQRPYTRFNDGACDKRGRFLAGTLYHPEAPEFGGVLYSYDPRTGETKVLDDNDITDSNGLGWSADGRTLYFTNSFLNHIYAYDYNEETGDVSNRRIFIDALAQGLPKGSFCDGLCIDDEGGIWSARWGGGCIARFRGTDGALDFVVNIPDVLNVTACTFGGPKNDLLYVTTAHCAPFSSSGDPSLQDAYPASGDLFVVDFHGRFHGGKWRFEFGE